MVVVNENYVLRIPSGYDLASAAPLVCAGITVYSPLKHWNIGKGTSVAIVGYGGLGHMAVKFAKALGADVTVITTDVKHKADLALKNGATRVIDSTDKKLMETTAKFDFILSTIPVAHDIMPYVDLLKRDGNLCIVGAVCPTKGSVDISHLTFDRRSISSSVTGSISETQKMLEFCADHHIKPDIKVISVDDVDDAFSELHDGDAGFRYVIDMNTLRVKKSRSLTASKDRIVIKIRKMPITHCQRKDRIVIKIPNLL